MELAPALRQHGVCPYGAAPYGFAPPQTRTTTHMFYFATRPHGAFERFQNWSSTPRVSWVCIKNLPERTKSQPVCETRIETIVTRGLWIARIHYSAQKNETLTPHESKRIETIVARSLWIARIRCHLCLHVYT